MSTRYPAHIRNTEDGGQQIQYVEEHCRAVASYAAQNVKGSKLENTAYLAGLVHDSGKFSQAYRDYLVKAVNNQPVRRGSVNHTFAGVRFVMEQYHQGKTEYENLTGEMIAYAAGSHHGLFDCIDEEKKNGFIHRVKKEGIYYEEAIQNYLDFCADKTELDVRFHAAEKEVEAMVMKIANLVTREDEQADTEMLFHVGVLARLLVSAVIDGDRKDTAEFMNDTSFPPERTEEACRKLWGDCLKRMEEKLEQFSADTKLNRARREISDQCRKAAENQPGIYRLNVPTGAGKTLSALRFALAHGAKYGKQRIIFTSPLLSILDQNAQVVRDYVQDDSLILEHHSNVVKTDEEQEELDKMELLMETWEAPIIITTLVQLLNTMFSGKTSSIRRFHSLQDAIIVIDEIQTVPIKMLSIFHLMLNFLVDVCGTTVVLCSATQPCMEALDYPLREPIFDMVPYDKALWQIFKRTEIVFMGNKSLNELAEFIKTEMEETDSLLVICNKKTESEYLHETLKDMEITLFHLSAAMCMEHRKNVLEDMITMLNKKNGNKILCISTQVIEAGVDISFQRVIRLSAGMDSVVQAAGRCNRNGEAGEGMVEPVYLISCKGENLTHLPEIQDGKDATESLLEQFSRCPECFQNDLSSEEAISSYYKKLYKQMPSGKADYSVNYGGRAIRLLDLLSVNWEYADEWAEQAEEFTLRQAFKLAGKQCKVFEEDTVDVIVSYGEGANIVADLCCEKAKQDFGFVKETLERAKPYTVSLYQYQIRQLNGEGVLHELPWGVCWLDGHYNEETGFTMKENEMDFLEVRE